MLLVGIDLASRHSAAVGVDQDGTVFLESTFDSGPASKPPNPFAPARLLAGWWTELSTSAAEADDEVYWVIEDIPPHGMVNPKPALKLQGALIGFMVLHGIECHVIPAKTWQDYFGYTKKEFGNSKTWAKDLAVTLGYTAPAEWPSGVKTKAKEREDLTDARCLAEWLKIMVAG